MKYIFYSTGKWLTTKW